MNKVAAKFVMVGCVLGLAGCAAALTKPANTVPGVVYDKPETVVQKAAVDALVANGFVISKSDAEYVEGARPHKMGLLVGSGGESAGVWLSSLGSDKTSVKVETAKSFAGRAGQKDWDKEIITDMDKSIGAHQ